MRAVMLLLYVLFLLLFAPQRDATTNKKKILCLGDSLTREGSWIHFVEEHFGTSNLMFINGGKNGRKSGQIFYPLVHTYTQQHKLECCFSTMNDSDSYCIIEFNLFQQDCGRCAEEYVQGCRSFFAVISKE